MQCEINKVERRRPKALYYINVDLFDDGKYKYLGTLNLLVNTTNEFKIRSMASTPALPPDTEPLLPQMVAPPPFISRPPTNQPARVFKAVEAISNDPAQRGLALSSSTGPGLHHRCRRGSSPLGAERYRAERYRAALAPTLSSMLHFCPCQRIRRNAIASFMTPATAKCPNTREAERRPQPAFPPSFPCRDHWHRRRVAAA